MHITLKRGESLTIVFEEDDTTYPSLSLGALLRRLDALEAQGKVQSCQEPQGQTWAAL